VGVSSGGIACLKIATAAPLAAVMEDDREQFAVVEMSDGAMRPWYLRDEDRRRGFVYGVGAVAFAIFGLVVSVLLGSVNGGINTLTRQTERSVEIASHRYGREYHIVSWCPCGRTMPAGALGSYQGHGVPLEDQTCDGCFYNLAYSAGDNPNRASFPKTDYDSAESTHSNLSFIYQMKKHNLTDEVIVNKCGWRKVGTAYYAYGQEEIDVRMCVVEDFINLMAQSGWFFSVETWYQTSKDQVIFVRYI
jgi:hypothetical protein